LSHCAVEDHFVTVDFSSIWKSVDARLQEMKKAREMIIEDPELLSGTAVIKGTRGPVYDIATHHRQRTRKKTS
jgi:Protein of unknown function (DUF433)